MISKLFFSFFFNLAAFWLISYFVEGVEIASGFKNFIAVALVFTFLNVFIKPVVKLILSPLIIITLGLGIVLVNAVMLYILDFFMDSVNIIGLASLFYSAVIISLINILVYFAGRR